MTQSEARQDGRSSAVAVCDDWCDVERREQPGGVVGLLVERCRVPVLRAWAARVGAPVVGQYRVLVCQYLADLCPVSGVAGRPGDEQDRRTRPAQFVVQVGSVDFDRTHVDLRDVLADVTHEAGQCIGRLERCAALAATPPRAGADDHAVSHAGR
jgi:hypothetical protein